METVHDVFGGVLVLWRRFIPPPCYPDQRRKAAWRLLAAMSRRSWRVSDVASSRRAYSSDVVVRLSRLRGARGRHRITSGGDPPASQCHTGRRKQMTPASQAGGHLMLALQQEQLQEQAPVVAAREAGDACLPQHGRRRVPDRGDGRARVAVGARARLNHDVTWITGRKRRRRKGKPRRAHPKRPAVASPPRKASRDEPTPKGQPRASPPRKISRGEPTPWAPSSRLPSVAMHLVSKLEAPWG